MSDERLRHSPVITAAFCFVAAFALYVLSVGPVVRYGGESSPMLTALYSPVAWMYHNTPLDKPLEWYLELWGVD
jgi:hypothetical protein